MRGIKNWLTIPSQKYRDTGIRRYFMSSSYELRHAL